MPRPSSDSSPLEAWQNRLRGEAERRRANHRERTLSLPPCQYDFASNDYLALNSSGTLERLLQRLVRNRQSEESSDLRVGSTGSRLLRGHHPAFEEAEAAFAHYTGQESALLFHSGYAANTGAIPALMGPRDLVLCDRLAHASLLDGIRLSGATRLFFRHNDLAHLEERLREARTHHRGSLWVVTESLFSMDGDAPSLRELVELTESYGALLYLDEGHALGVTGPGGAGLAAGAGLSSRVAVTAFPLGKAPGIMGAFVCGAGELKDKLINEARSFIFSTAQPPLLARLAREVTELLPQPEMEEARARLRELHTRFRRRLREGGLSTGHSVSQIVPVLTGTEQEALRLMELCLQEGMDVRAIRPPTVPEGSSRLRVNLHADHTPEVVDQLAELLIRSIRRE